MAIGIGLFSGGLDSILSVRILQEQNIQVEAVSFVTPFFGPEAAKKAISQLGITLHIVDITEKHIEMLKNPKHGYGKNMNPCIDCHALMFSQAGHIMKKMGGDFLFSGEVLGERPMSQNRGALKTVAIESGFENYIIRPLSAKLLPATKPERDGIVDREKLFSIKGRSRKPQIELARRFGITYYPNPAGGCLLTDSSFSSRLRDLFNSSGEKTKRDYELLRVGRHMRVSDAVKIVVGRNEKENEKILYLSKEGDIILTIEDIPGPVVVIPYGANDDVVKFAAAICVQYSDALENEQASVTVFHNREVQHIAASAYPRQLLKNFII